MRPIVILFVLAGLLVGMQANAGKPAIKIKIVHPVSGGLDDDSVIDGESATSNVSIQNFSGYPLTLEFTMKNELGIASGPAGFFPVSFKTGFVVFEDPDNCLVFEGYVWDIPAEPFPVGDGCPLDPDTGFPVPPPVDETYFEFSVDTDGVGIEDEVGNPARLVALASAGSGQPTIDQVAPLDPMTMPVPIGPPTGAPDPMNPGSEIVDGYGYGADDDLPGAVILVRHGPGIVYDTTDGIATSPLTLRNLAGFINSVSYELSNARSKTTIIAHMNVPPFLVAPVIVADDNFGIDGDPDTNDTNVLWRIDGAADIVQAEDVLGEPIGIGSFNSYPNLVDEFRYTISVMAVSGIAPDVVVDMNGDNRIDEADLEAMSYKVLGKKKSVSFDLFPAAACFGGTGNTVFADLDGNGNNERVAVCPSGPGSVSKPPR